MISNADFEGLLEEKNELENDLRIAELSLEDSQKLNEDFLKENISRVIRFQELERLHNELKDDLPLDIELFHTERSCMMETFEFDSSIEDMKLMLLQLAKQRFTDLLAEFDSRQYTSQYLESALSEAGVCHVDAMHDLNKALVKKERRFEESFRSSLNRASISHSVKAATGLSEENRDVLNRRDSLLGELDIQRKGMERLQAQIELYQEELRTREDFGRKMKLECDSLRQQMEQQKSSIGEGLTEECTDLLSLDNHKISHPTEAFDAQTTHFDQYISTDTIYRKWNNRLDALHKINDGNDVSELSPHENVYDETDKERIYHDYRQLAVEDAEFRSATEVMYRHICGLQLSDSVDGTGPAWKLARLLTTVWIDSDTEIAVTVPSLSMQVQSDLVTSHNWIAQAKKKKKKNDFDLRDVYPKDRQNRVIQAGKGLSCLVQKGSLVLPIISSQKTRQSIPNLNKCLF